MDSKENRIPFIEQIISAAHDIVPGGFSEAPPPAPPIWERLKLGKETRYSGPSDLDSITDDYAERVRQGFDSIGQIEEDIVRYGVEALAWYRSYHWEPKEFWGIYIRVPGIIYLARKILLANPTFRQGNGPKELIHFAFAVLRHHETFHFLTDSFATSVELITHTPRYIPYVLMVYARGWPGCPEEALANRHVLQKLDERVGIFGKIKSSALRTSLVDFFIQQPAEYRNFGRFLGNEFSIGRSFLCNLVIFHQDLSEPLDLLSCPVGVVPERDVPLYFVQW